MNARKITIKTIPLNLCPLANCPMPGISDSKVTFFTLTSFLSCCILMPPYTADLYKTCFLMIQLVKRLSLSFDNKSKTLKIRKTISRVFFFLTSIKTLLLQLLHFLIKALLGTSIFNGKLYYFLVRDFNIFVQLLL